MATSTPNLNLILPDYSDKADISVLNDNFQKIDEHCANGGGAGTVTSVNKVEPDATGNVTLTAENVGALSSGGTAKDSEKLGGKAPEYYATDEFVSQLSDQKANVIIDTSARAASHELHAQRGPMSVTLFGKTTETGTGDKSPDNPYAISGVAGAHVRAGGKNLISGWIVGETINNSSGAFMTSTFGDKAARTDYMPISPGKRYVLSNMPTDMFNFVALYDGNKNFVRRIGESALANRSVSPDDTKGCYYAAVAQYWNKDVSTDTSKPNATTSQFESGGAATAYEPYNANVITPALLPDGKPLMGNGTVDDTIENDVLVDGERKCRVTRRWGMVTLDGSENWKLASTGWFYLDGLFSDANATAGVHLLTPGLFSDYLPVSNPTEDSKSCFNLWMTGDGLRRLGVKMISVTTLDEFIGHLSENPLKVGYILVTPETYMTDPLPLRKPDTLDAVTTIVTGSAETAVTYPRDTKDFGKAAASAMIGAAESGMTATQNYASGAFIVNKDTLTLYRATKAIAKGETITPGTNCAATTVVEQLANLYTLLNA